MCGVNLIGGKKNRLKENEKMEKALVSTKEKVRK